MLLDEFGGRRLYEGEYEFSRKERVLYGNYYPRKMEKF